MPKLSVVSKSSDHISKKVKKQLKAFVVFPNCLFPDTSALLGYDKVFVVEEPLFFGRDALRPYNINKVKLAWMRASMQCYTDKLIFEVKLLKSEETKGDTPANVKSSDLELKSAKTEVESLKLNEQKVEYVEYSQVESYKFLANYSVTFWDPVDYQLEEKIKSHGIEYTMLDSKLFLMPTESIKTYFKSKGEVKRYTQAHFYTWIKKELGVLENVTSKDEENRKPLPKNHKFTFSTPDFDVTDDKVYYTEAKEYINNHPLFKDNIGNFDKLHLYPINTEGAKIQFLDFIEHRANNFGPYEDAIDKTNVILFHSFISAPLNNGLLCTHWTLDTIMNARDKIHINSLEGWVRQLTWREYQRSLYTCFYSTLIKANHFEHAGELDWSYWHGHKKIGIEILDNEIAKAVEYGYSHHIPRLCIFLNIFNLLGVKLDHVVQWFSEVIAMDAYPWVMYSNIVSMGYYDTKYMQKPYITSSAYLLKMSNYSKGSWCDTWTALFYAFLHRKKSLLTGGATVYLRNLAYFEKKGKQDQDGILALADKLISKVTTSGGKLHK